MYTHKLTVCLGSTHSRWFYTPDSTLIGIELQLRRSAQIALTMGLFITTYLAPSCFVLAMHVRYSIYPMHAWHSRREPIWLSGNILFAHYTFQCMKDDIYQWSYTVQYTGHVMYRDGTHSQRLHHLSHPACRYWRVACEGNWWPCLVARPPSNQVLWRNNANWLAATPPWTMCCVIQLGTYVDPSFSQLQPTGKQIVTKCNTLYRSPKLPWYRRVHCWMYLNSICQQPLTTKSGRTASTWESSSKCSRWSFWFNGSTSVVLTPCKTHITRETPAAHILISKMQARIYGGIACYIYLSSYWWACIYLPLLLQANWHLARALGRVRISGVKVD